MSGGAVFNPLTPEFRSNPYPDLHRLRREDPVHWSALGCCWVLTRYEDIKFVLSDRRFGIGLDILSTYPGLKAVMSEPYNQIIRTQILAADPPDHPRIRGLLSRAFSAQQIEALRLLIQRVADDLIDAAQRTGKIDLIADFAVPLPFGVICEILGIPEEERPPLLHYTHDLMRTTDPTPMSSAETERSNGAAVGFRDYFLALAARRRKAPTEDIFTELVQAVDQGNINDEELVANSILLFCAGHDTVINLFGNGTLALHRNRRQIDLLKEDPSLLRNAVEELLRFDTSVQIGRRLAFEDVDVGARRILRGQYVLCSLGAANRDPEVYDDPDRLDITRKNIRPLSFGGGIHHCLGAQLARVEGEVGFSTLLRRLPDLELRTLDPEWKQNTFIRGLKALHGTFAGVSR